jgi:aminomethyltransferase
VRSCGLGARDTLRLEAGMNLYGNDMDEHTNPLESGLAWTVAFAPTQRDFIGRAALELIRARGSEHKRVGLVLQERAVLRSHQRVIVSGGGEGEVTSGTYSPTLSRSIGLARVPISTGASVQVEVRGRMLPALTVRPPFVRHGRPLIQL